MNERSIFMEALEKDTPARRSAYLEGACGGDAVLRQRVEALLASHEQAGSFLGKPVAERLAEKRATPERAEESPAEPPGGAGHDQPLTPGLPATLDEPAVTKRPGTIIGPYKLLQQLGEGGMGTVYMAEQTHPVQRKVALKVIKAGMDGRQIIARFEVERQALAMMDHVNIARVLDAGATQSGRPYFVMELVHGVPITKYCDDNHLTPRQRLELFVPVCQAIQHAHQKGIIHRDIKPSNVMITLYEGKPVPKVIDFGVAKATEQKLTERTLFTQYGTMVGTLEYMSPEQAEMSALGADTRSDIFSLGVLLYELLTGGTPLSHKRLKEAAYGEILRMIREEEAPRPSARLSESGEALASISAHRHMEPAKLTKLVRGELDWIVMKCLEKDRNRRYETANGFAMDVQRYLNDETVQACPPSGWYRFRKFARRNKAALVMASVVGVAVLLLLAVLAVGIVLVNREKEFVKDERDQKDQALQLADANLIQAHESVNRYLTIVSEDTLLDAPGLQPLRKQLLEAALKYYQSFLQQRSHDPELQADVAMTYLRVAVIYNSLGEYDEATLALITGLETVDRLVREHPGDTELSKRFAGYFTTRRPFHTTGRAMKTDPRRVLQALQRSAELWEGFARENPNIPGFRSDLLATYMLLGGLLAGSNQDEAFRTYRKASETAEKLVHENPAVPSHQERLAQIYYDVAGALKGLGRTQEAETTYRQAVECFEKSAAEFPGEPEFRANLGISLKHLANFFAVYKRDKEAEDTFRRSVALLDKAVNDFPDKVDYRDALSVSYEGLANFLARDSGRVQEAEKVLRQALTLQEKLAADFPHVPNYRRALASSYGTLSDVLKKDRPKEAVQALRQKLTVREKLMIDYPTIERYRGELLETQEQLINLLLYTGQSLEVEKLYRQAIVRFEKLAAANPSVPEYRRELAWNHNRLGILLRNAGRAPEAENELRKAIDLYEKLLVDFPAVLAYRTRLVDLLNKTGKGKDVERVDREAISRLEKLAAAHPKSSRLTQELAQLLRSVGRMPETLALWEKLVAEYPGNDYYRLQLANSHNDLGTMLKAAGRHAEAEQAYRQALALKEKLVADSPANPDYRFHLAHSCLGLAYLFSDTKRRQEAERFYSQALALFEKLSDDVPSQDNYRMEVGHVLWQLADLSSTAGHHAEAEKILRRSLGVFEKLAADFPKIPYYRVEQGFTHWKLGWLMNSLSRPREAEEPFRQAMAVYKKLAADYPQNQDYRLRLAQSYNYLAEVLVRQGKHAERAGQWDNAAAEYTKAIELKPDAWEAWSGRAFVHFNRQQWDTAISDFSKAIDLAPQVHTNWWHRGHAYLQLAQWAKAAANFGKVVAQWPDGSEGWYLRSVAFAQLHQPDEALADLRQAIAKGFNNVEQMKNDPKLDPLRAREDFKKLVAELEAKKK